MEQLINGSFWAYLYITIFILFLIFGGVYSVFASTKKTGNTALKRVIRISISIILVCFWLWFSYKDLYPISLVKYEYDHNISDTKSGIIENVERRGKDRIYVTIDNIEYVIVEDRSSPYSNDISKIIKKGSNVSFSYGKKSKFIFDISKADTTYESFLGDVSIVFANSIDKQRQKNTKSLSFTTQNNDERSNNQQTKQCVWTRH